MATAVAVLTAQAPTLFDVEEGLTAFLDTAEMVKPEELESFLADFQVALTTAADKRDRVAGRIAQLEAQQEYAAAEIKRLQGFKKSKESEQTRLEGYVSYVILRLGKDAKGKYRRLEGHTSTLFLRSCAPSVEVIAEDRIPLDYKRAMVHLAAALWDDILNALDPGFRDHVLAATTNDLSVTVDKLAIKGAIEARIDVPGAKLITDKTTLGRK